MRAVRPLLLCLLLAAPVATAEAGERDPFTCLRSDDPQEVAWGAWLASRDLVREARPLVSARLRDYAARRPTTAERWAVWNLLDAAIRLGELPVRADLLALTRWDADAVVTLALRHLLTSDETLLALFDRFDRFDRGRASIEQWLAVGNRLHARRTPGFGARTLRRLRFERRVHVWDRYGPYPPWLGPGGSVPGDGFIRIPEGHPPIAIYWLELDTLGDDAPLSDGLRSVYVWRRVYEERRIWFSMSGHKPDRTTCRLEWLGAWLATPEGGRARRRTEEQGVAVLPEKDLIHFRWTGRQPWAREWRQIQAALHERYFDMARALVRRGLVTEDEARTLATHFEFEVVDLRDVKRPPLPPIPAFEPANPWVRKRRRS